MQSDPRKPINFNIGGLAFKVGLNGMLVSACAKPLLKNV